MSTSQTKISQDANIDNLLQTGFETIVQAFELKTTTYQATIKEQNNTISELQTKLKLLKEEMEILKQENAFYKKENEQLRHKNLKLSSSLKNSQSRLMNIKHSIKEENNYNNYSNTNETESALNDNDTEHEYLNDQCKPLTDRREIQRKTNKENTKTNLFSHMSSHRSSSNIYSKNSKHVPTSLHSIKKNMSSRNEATILPYKTTLDPYSTNGMHQINSPLSHSNSMKFNQRCQNSYQCNDYNQYDDNNNSNVSNLSTQLKQSDLMNQFLDQCKLYLTPGNYNRIVDSFQEYKDGLMNDDEIISRTRMLLQGSSTLLHLFESLFLL